MCPFDKQHLTQKEEDQDWKVAELPIVDNGYYDTLAAIGFGALADSYFDTPKTPLIEWAPKGFKIHYVEKLRSTPDLHWLKYSLAASWAGSLDEGITKKTSGWDGSNKIEHDGAVVNTAENPVIEIEINNKKKEIKKPERTLYGAINGNLKKQVTWFNLCVYTCRERGMDLLRDDFEEKSITLNSIIYPQGSKGANSGNSFSISNGSLSKKYSASLSRLTCLAIAGLVYSAIGEIPTGFAIPIPKRMRMSALQKIALDNRKRYVSRGFFFPFDNYLNLVKLLLIHNEEFESKLGETSKLKGVAGASFVELGTSASPSGTWQLMIPSHKYSIESVKRLQNLLVNWRREKTVRKGSDPSIDRKAVRTLMNGFESSNPQSAAEGYLQYIDAVGLQDNYNLLNQTFFEEIMAHSTKYQELLEQFKSEEIQRFIQLLRQDTIQKVYRINGKKDPPNYQVIRKLREIQSADDFVEAITEIAVERGSNKLASAQGSENAMQYMSLPYEGSMEKLITLAEDSRFTPRLIAQLLLAFALSSQKSKEEPKKEG